MNVHTERWLKFSNGLESESACAAHGFKQHVKSLSCGEYLLDQVLLDLGGRNCVVLFTQEF